MDCTQPTTNHTPLKQNRWDRDEVSRLLQQIYFDQHEGKSLNQSALNNAVPRATVQNWVRNRLRLQQHGGLDPAVVRFFRITPRARLPSSTLVCGAFRLGTSQRWWHSKHLLALGALSVRSILGNVLWCSAHGGCQHRESDPAVRPGRACSAC